MSAMTKQPLLATNARQVHMGEHRIRLSNDRRLGSIMIVGSNRQGVPRRAELRPQAQADVTKNRGPNGLGPRSISNYLLRSSGLFSDFRNRHCRIRNHRRPRRNHNRHCRSHRRWQTLGC